MTWFVAEWEENISELTVEITRIWTWEDWCKQMPISVRNLHSALVDARDEVEAYLKAQRGEVLE